MWDPGHARDYSAIAVHRSGLGSAPATAVFPTDPFAQERRAAAQIKPDETLAALCLAISLHGRGQLMEEVIGKTGAFVRRKLRPAPMTLSTVSDAEFQATEDRALPHTRTGGAIVGMGTQQVLSKAAALGANAAPAGALAISANDMTRWLATQLARGEITGSGKRLFSAEQSAEMWKPVILQPISELPPQFKATQPNFDTYALGWDVQDYRGAKIISHGGAVFGSLATVALIPDHNVGLYIAVNSNEGEIVRGLMYELLDHYLGLPADQWPERFHAFKTDRQNQAAKAVQSAATKPANVGPSLSLDRYVGDYADPWYGTIKVRRSAQGLNIEFPHSTGMSGALAHHQYDSFRTNPSLFWVEPAYVTFSIDADGKVDRVTMKAVSPLADFSFDYQDLLFTPVTKAMTRTRNLTLPFEAII